MDWKALLADFVAKLNEATKDKTDDERRKLVAEATDALPQAARQHLHDLGHAEGVKEGEKKGTGDTATIEAERDAAKKAQEAAEAKAKTLEEQLAEKQPEVAKIRSEYEAALSAKDEEVKAAKEAGAKALADARTEAAQRQLVAGLGARVLTPAIARGIANDPQTLSRIAVADDGTITAYQADGKTPLALASGQTAVDALVADLAGSLDKSVLKSTADGGSGAGGGGTAEASEAEAIRQEVKSQYGGDAADARKRLEAL